VTLALRIADLLRAARSGIVTSRLKATFGAMQRPVGRRRHGHGALAVKCPEAVRP
jgi:hypothetical protein